MSPAQPLALEHAGEVLASPHLAALKAFFHLRSRPSSEPSLDRSRSIDRGWSIDVLCWVESTIDASRQCRFRFNHSGWGWLSINCGHRRQMRMGCGGRPPKQRTREYEEVEAPHAQGAIWSRRRGVSELQFLRSSPLACGPYNTEPEFSSNHHPTTITTNRHTYTYHHHQRWPPRRLRLDA